MKLGRAVLVAVLLCSLAEASWADKKTETEARTYYDQGTKYYALGRFEEAIQNYEKAFELRPDPVLLYNIAQAYRLSKNFERALFFYKSFLRNMPDAPNRPEVERRIGEMEAALKTQETSSQAPPVGTYEPGTRPPVTSPEPSPSPSPGPGTVIPKPETVAGGSDTGKETATPPDQGPTDHGGGKRPIYKKWWFWAGVGAVAVGTVAIVVATSGGGAERPGTDFGYQDIF